MAQIHYGFLYRKDPPPEFLNQSEARARPNYHVITVKQVGVKGHLKGKDQKWCHHQPEVTGNAEVTWFGSGNRWPIGKKGSRAQGMNIIGKWFWGVVWHVDMGFCIEKTHPPEFLNQSEARARPNYHVITVNGKWHHRGQSPLEIRTGSDVIKNRKWLEMHGHVVWGGKPHYFLC